MKKIILPFLSLFVVLALTSCGPKVRRVQSISAADATVDANWSPEDIQKVTQHMANSISEAKFTTSMKYRTEKPRWMLSKELRNDSDEHINTRVLIEKIRTRLINDQIGIFIDDQALDDALEQLELQQSDLYDNTKAAQVGRLVGAKLVLRGAISNIRKRDLRTDINFYNITLQVVDMETLQILWTDEIEIGRKAQKGRFR